MLRTGTNGHITFNSGWCVLNWDKRLLVPMKGNNVTLDSAKGNYDFWEAPLATICTQIGRNGVNGKKI